MKKLLDIHDIRPIVDTLENIERDLVTALMLHDDSDGKIFYFEYLDVYWMDEYGEWVG